MGVRYAIYYRAPGRETYEVVHGLYVTAPTKGRAHAMAYEATSGLRARHTLLGNVNNLAVYPCADGEEPRATFSNRPGFRLP